ncbi:Transcription factor [Acorus gramineus]|uniref:Transcription factor n=1 Tax=Acorus gramineus TaxID=55184 RepID=A0AAV9B4H0_ACOGR|nr:Transcription factor [Acorus gramineus]
MQRHPPSSMYGPNHHNRPMMSPSGLARYGSAPGSFLTSLVDSAVSCDAAEFHSPAGSSAAANLIGGFFSGESSPCATSESASATASPDRRLERSYGFNEIGGGRGRGSPLIRHSSSPAGFFSHLMVDNGFSVSRGMGGYTSQGSTESGHAMMNSRLKSQLSFSRQDSLSQISEISIPESGESAGRGCNSSDEGGGHAGQSYVSGNFSMGSWDEPNSMVFSGDPSGKRARDNDGHIIAGLSSLDSQFSMPKTALEMATVEKFLQLQPDTVPCKIRAKRGCATHPRSIAERERRTRISEKLRKLQELVPNMDKQTNTADMLDLAVKHIKSLQGEVEKLNEERANCTCAHK